MGKNMFLSAIFLLLIAVASSMAEDFQQSRVEDQADFPILLLPIRDIPQGRVITELQDIDDAVSAGADYLKGMQADVTEDNAGNGFDGIDENPDDPDDGGWDWIVMAPLFHHTENPSPTNLYGVTATGLYYAYLPDPDPLYMTALQDAANAMVAAGPTAMRTARDLVFLMRFDDLPEIPGTAYMDAAKAKYDSRISQYGSAQALAEFIRDYRAGQGYPCGIIAWDIAAFVVAAQMLDGRFPGNNYDSDADDMAEVIYQDSFNHNPGYFDIIEDQGWDPGYGNPNYYWYTLGISGILDAFTVADVHTSEIPGLLSILDECRYPSGAYSYSYGANAGDEDWQSTAYSVLSLANYDQTTYQSSINESALWIASTQDQSGGFVYSNGEHLPEIGGECTAAMSFGEPAIEIPTLSQWGLIVLGFLLLALGTAAVVTGRTPALSKGA